MHPETQLMENHRLYFFLPTRRSPHNKLKIHKNLVNFLDPVLPGDRLENRLLHSGLLTFGPHVRDRVHTTHTLTEQGDKKSGKCRLEV